jgi:hypothetical protein
VKRRDFILKEINICRAYASMFFIVALALVAAPLQIEAGQEKGRLYVTWKGIEVDKCAAAWVIQSHVDAEARFMMIERGKVVTGGGLPFDTPQGELRVTHNATTFDAVLRKYKLSDAALFHMAEVVRDVEMKRWDAAPSGIGKGLEAVIYGLSLKEGDGLEALKSSFSIFDYLYEYFNALEK